MQNSETVQTLAPVEFHLLVHRLQGMMLLLMLLMLLLKLVLLVNMS